MLPFQQDIDACLDVLQKGGLILYPTDTIWGIGCDATNEDAVKRIYQLKHRADNKAMIVLVADEKDILRHVTQPDLQIFDYIKGVTKPTTVIYEGGVGLASNLLGGDGSVAIRICGDTFCKHLIRRFRKPIVSTSANLSGYPPPQCFRDIEPVIHEGVVKEDNTRPEDEEYPKPTTVIKWKKAATRRNIRP